MKAPTLSERLVTKLSSGLFAKRASRRSFLTASAVVGSAIAVDPWTFFTRPVTAYATVCGSGAACSDGWSVFCCTINHGANTCPAGSFVGGWWQCNYGGGDLCGTTNRRYYMDCNVLPGQSCPGGCHCGNDDCNNFRTCCITFRYGQCNTQIGAITPIVCRLVTCIIPCKIDCLNCGCSSATDQVTCGHNAGCL